MSEVVMAAQAADQPWVLVGVLIAAAYVFGSVSFAWLAGRAKGIDLRQHGSGNLGATNAGRVLGARWFVAVFTADLLKGLVPVLAVGWLLPGVGWLPLAAGAAAVLGHVFTCFHGFKGGKAVATSLGVLIALAPIVAGIAFLVWLASWLLGRVAMRGTAAEAVGPASVMSAFAVVPARLFTAPDRGWIADHVTTAFLIALAILVIVRHRSNIAKMLAKRQPPADPPPTA